MQIKTAAVVLALLGSALAVPAPGTNTVRSLARRAGENSPSRLNIPPPDPVRCAELEEECDCSRIPKDDIEGWFQCTTNFLCEWCAGLWTEKHEEEEEKPEKPKASEAARGRDVLWK
ncbi:hypothetical protein B0T11DRAFT_326045 [Plectosphaerella cucumerina]|uniref:Uncharacterized protein n=1 Tax=Plectosphaerella cucumerina TaxID=40658 RepID=A0A8K0TR78_9PEZI|nr:hypothetical protein B0T11DRAFT_326045 [Plectosphaerella cucumerina]